MELAQLESMVANYVNALAVNEREVLRIATLWEHVGSHVRPPAYTSMIELYERQKRNAQALQAMLVSLGQHGYADLDERLAALFSDTGWPTCRLGAAPSCGKCVWRLFLTSDALRRHLKK